ncbi:MAG: LytTR family DNA-binding domain-containing protein [Oscillospiraceae bacterium]|nr:LytTR family DNA-binding domain-containing protein [Oscillospiraceae bacterium]
MLHIFICEDRSDQRELIERLVNNVLIENDCNVDFAISFDNPINLLNYLRKNPVKNALYFLDVDLQHEMNGIELGAQIRGMDVSATIAFITTHSEMAHLVFAHKVEALEYILKDDPKKMEIAIKECIQLACERYMRGKHSERKYFMITTGGSAWNIPYDDILYFETDTDMPNRLILHTKTGRTGYRGKLHHVTAAAPEFFACQRSFVVNPKNIKHVVTARRKKQIEMVNGDIIPISKSKIQELLDRLERLE